MFFKLYRSSTKYFYLCYYSGWVPVLIDSDVEYRASYFNISELGIELLWVLHVFPRC